MPLFLDKTASLTPAARRVIDEQATESPYSGSYNTVLTQGSYLCRRCGLALFRADSQFASGCGWPSFDVAIPNAVKKLPDPDGLRIEIRCQRCDAHLGHVFEGEYLTAKNRRYCVNSVSLDFIANSDVINSEEAILAGGCFWGVDHYLRQIPGVLNVESGYTGGTTPEPTYNQVCGGGTGHYEAVRVLFDSTKTDYHAVVKRFFEIHDPTQPMGQGPDLGHQYQSAVFYYNNSQYAEASALIEQLTKKGYDVVTQLLPAPIFWPAEEYHQNYYARQRKKPYCHQPVMRFE